MNTKLFVLLFIVFGVLFTSSQCGRLTERAQDDDDDDSAADDNSDSGEDDQALRQEKMAIRSFLEDQDEANHFLDQSRRLFSSDQKSHMKDAKKAYEDKCERLLHPRYCPDLATWPAWNQAFNTATGKK